MLRLKRKYLNVLASIFIVTLFLYFLSTRPIRKKSSKEEVSSIQKSKNDPIENADQPVKPVISESKLTHDKVVFEKKGLSFTGPTNERQQKVTDAFLHAWKGYKQYAWGHDHLKPISKTYDDWFYLGLTIIDSLDTIYIMGLTEEFKEARTWIENSLSYATNFQFVSVFETTIRVLGGLLSAFHLSEDKIFLDKALDLGKRLLPSFKSPSGVPYSDLSLRDEQSVSTWREESTTAEVASIQLEFRDLSRCTGDPTFEEVAFNVSKLLHNLSKTDGLVPMFINVKTGQFLKTTLTLGARADSYYEYLLKQWIQTGRTIDFLRDDYKSAINGIIKHLVHHSKPNNLPFLGMLEEESNLSTNSEFKFTPQMDHLACFLPGTLALGVHYGMPQEHMQLAKDLINTCYQTYAVHPTHLAPEISFFNEDQSITSDIIVKPADAHNLLRPETVESLWYMYHLTGNKTYQDWGWKIFQGFEEYARFEFGYSSIGDVRSVSNTQPRDKMESFFLSETLKYFYLLFSDSQDILSVDRFVMNTEAHFLPIRKT